jgi:predicted RNase H-like HicB family nuclease
MLYPVYIHLGDDTNAHGVTIPDFPGCFTAADSFDDLPRMVQEAVELWCEGEDADLPMATPLERLAVDPNYQGGVWLLVDIDISRLETKSVRINVSLPNYLLEQIDRYAKAHGATRSGFLAKAAQQAMRG